MSINFSKVKLPPKIRMDCYRMALYPILKYYNLDAELLLIAKKANLGYEEKLICKESECINIGKMFNDFGIESLFMNLVNKEKVMSVIKTAIDNDCFVICFMDVFYYSPFKSIFQKTHTVHGIPIYGYDDEKRVFYSIDSDYMESFNRVFAKVPYDDIINSVIGYSNLKKSFNIQVLKKDDSKTIPSFSVDSIRQKYATQYGERINLTEYNKYGEELKSLYNYISVFCTSEDEMIKFSKQSYKYIDQFINARMLEYYGMPSIFENIDDLQNFNYVTVEKSNFIRSIMYRTVYTGEYRQKSFEKFPECFNSILNNEKKRLEFMNTFQWENNIKPFNI